MGSEARARLGLAGVLVVALLSFNQLFAAGDYPGPALLGALLATALAMAARRVGVGSLSTLALSAAGLGWYVAFVFQTDRTLFGLPTPDALARAARSVERALSFSQIDFAPVPVRPGYVILVVAGMWAAATLGELATFRWKRPLLAVLPSVVLFSITMVVGTGDGGPVLVPLFLAALLTFWGLESSHRLRSWGRWVATWPGHASEEPESVTGPLARRMGAGCVAVALFAPIFLPALGDGLVSWRNELTEGLGSGNGGSGGSGRIDPLVSIAPSLVRQSDRILFRVTANRPTYWRLATLLHFDGENWQIDEEESEIPVDGAEMPQRWLPWAENATRVDQTISLSGLQGRYLPAAVQADEVDILEEGRRDDLRYNPTTGDLRLDGEIGGELEYGVSSVAPTPRFRDLADASIGSLAPPVSRERPQLSGGVVALRDQWIEGETSAYGRLVAIQDALRSGAFSYQVPRPEELTGHQLASTDHLSNFLLETRTGYCQQFATAFAALSRSLGYPTRVVVGFLPGESVGENEYVVRGTDAHAWPEVYFEGWGWIRFEPTPRVDSTRTVAAPDYTFPAGTASLGPLGSDGGAAARGNNANAPQSTLDARALNDAGEQNSASAIELQELARRGLQGGDVDEETNAIWERTFRRLVLALLAAVAAGLVAVPMLKARRIQRLYRRAAGSRATAAAAFHEFMLEAGELAAPRGPAESARAYAQRIAVMKELSEKQVLRLATIYERAAYSAAEPAAEDGREARTLARELRATLWHKATWWERGARLFSLRPSTL